MAIATFHFKTLMCSAMYGFLDETNAMIGVLVLREL